MCSYNKVMGDWACENDWLLNHVLKGAWHFPGFVVSDWDGTHSSAKAANAGLDLQMPGEEYFGEALKQAASSGRVPLERLDDMVRRLLRSMFSAGVIDHPPTMEMAGDEDIEARRGGGCLRGERSDLISRAFSLQRLVVKQTITGAGCHERVGIGTHLDNGVPIVIEAAMPCAARRTRIRLQYNTT